MASSPAAVAARIRRLRLQANMTQARFARKVGVSQQKLSDWENGKRLRAVLDAMRLAQLFSEATKRRK